MQDKEEIAIFPAVRSGAPSSRLECVLGHCSYLIHPALMRAFIMIASQSSRDTLKRSRIPACLIVFPSLDSLQPSKSSVAQSARPSIDFIPCSPKATSIRVVTPGISLSPSSTSSRFRLASTMRSDERRGSELGTTLLMRVSGCNRFIT
jgi:hypothetical protein